MARSMEKSDGQLKLHPLGEGTILLGELKLMSCGHSVADGVRRLSKGI